MLFCSKYRAEAMAKEADNILRNFKRDRELKKLSHNEEQLHKFERYLPYIQIECFIVKL